MNDSYLISFWKTKEETFVHKCLEDIYKRKKFEVKNFHKHDRVNENGIDVLCEKDDISIGFAVKKKPRSSDKKQLDALSKNEVNKKIYIYLAPPTKIFKDKMKETKNIEFWDWSKLHEELILNCSKDYLIGYFSVHPLIITYFKIFKIFFKNRHVKFKEIEIGYDENSIFWNIKDDAVKLKAVLDFLKSRWNSRLMNKTQYDKEEYLPILDEIHSDLDIINSKFGKELLNSFINIEKQYPYLLGKYWNLVSKRTEWKTFTTICIHLFEKDNKLLDYYIINNWILPSINNGKFAGVMNQYYSTMNYFLENTYEISKDLEDGIDWLYSSLSINTNKK